MAYSTKHKAQQRNSAVSRLTGKQRDIFGERNYHVLRKLTVCTALHSKKVKTNVKQNNKTVNDNWYSVPFISIDPYSLIKNCAKIWEIKRVWSKLIYANMVRIYDHHIWYIKHHIYPVSLSNNCRKIREINNAWPVNILSIENVVRTHHHKNTENQFWGWAGYVTTLNLMPFFHAPSRWFFSPIAQSEKMLIRILVRL